MNDDDDVSMRYCDIDISSHSTQTFSIQLKKIHIRLD